MELTHHNLNIKIDDAWLIDAGMENFTPKERAYRVDKEKAKGKEFLEIRIDEISPVTREPGVPIFNTCPNTKIDARTRATKILRGFVSDDAFEPVEVYSLPPDSKFCYELKDGAHRLYCSLASGFTHIPAVILKKFDSGTRS